MATYRQRAGQLVVWALVVAFALALALAEGWLPFPVRLAWGLLNLGCVLVSAGAFVDDRRARRRAVRRDPRSR